MVDFKVQVYDGSYHEVDSSEMAFKIAGSLGFKDGMSRANVVLLEPSLKVQTLTPEVHIITEPWKICKALKRIFCKFFHFSGCAQTSKRLRVLVRAIRASRPKITSAI